ncbi:MAG TPA: lactate utilization protein B [Puia sp.]|jgi:L-lactate dehydrogenase complex protein LldF|nr:lactate utilization protein B [Puia sp.]
MTDHASLAAAFNKDELRVDWHDATLWQVRKKRDVAAASVPEWEQLRELASQIKEHTLSDLDRLLIQFEKNAQDNGMVVHWAADAREHNEIILRLIRSNHISRIVKSKSMLTEECHLNEFLAEKGIAVTDTDLGEYIVQLRQEPPSHIVLPAIHLKREDVSATFHKHLDTQKGNNDPSYLTAAARKTLRNKFVQSDLAITGINFAVAGTGAFVVCTNEGNADMGAHTAPLHIACMGIEKIIPKTEHLGVFLRLLARSATGQPITTYSSHFLKPRAGRQIHIVIVDNGRSRHLAKPDFRNALKCIRCAACLNTCPVYRRSGGHSYHSTVAGPIGAILNPNMEMRKNADLPFASTLCGSCSNVCPVKIDIHAQLWKWRQILATEGILPANKKRAMKGMAFIFSAPRLYRFAGKLGRITMRFLPFLIANKLWNPWYRQREMPQPPGRSFHSWWRNNRYERKR